MSKLVVLAAVAALALALAGSAGAKQTNLSVSTAGSPHAGAPSTVTVRVSLRGKPYAKAGWRPTLYLVRKGAYLPAATYRGASVAPGTFRVRVVFPRAGAWKYVIPDPVMGDWTFLAPRVKG
jgi:hypothetical protein